MTLRLGRAGWTVLLSAAVVITLDAAGVRRPASADAVRPLVRLLNRSGQRAIAVADPRRHGFFVAALYTGSDIFLVRARHPAPEELNQQIHARRYQRVFFALRATPTPSEKVLVYDAQADGIHAQPGANDSCDEVREDDLRMVRFNGDLTGQHLTMTEYADKMAAVDAQYSRLLKLLVSAGV